MIDSDGPPASGKMRVLLAEDHRHFQEAITPVLAQSFDVVGVIEHGNDVLKAAARVQPDIVVLDIALPGRTGLQLLPDLRQALPQASIVMLTTYTEPLYREEALRRGADTYVTKHRAARELLPAIWAAIVARAKQHAPPPDIRLELRSRSVRLD